MIRYGVDSSGQTYYASVIDDKGEVVLSGDGWSSPKEILHWYGDLVRAIGSPIQVLPVDG
jgi:hypothetical protein